MTDPTAFAKLVPGFDFLQNLAKNAGAALPGINQWIAPTLDPAELEKRIEGLRTVQYWLEQNARMLGTTIQALEVQRMTLSTLKTMNVQMEDLRESMQIRMPTMPTPSAPEPEPAPPPEPRTEAAPPAEAASPAPGAGIVDPMQWWGALTRQFTELASNAIREATPATGKGNDSGAPAASSPSTPRAASKPSGAAPRKAAARKSARRKASPPRT